MDSDWNVPAGTMVMVVNHNRELIDHLTKQDNSFATSDLIKGPGVTFVLPTKTSVPMRLNAAQLHESGFHIFRTNDARWPYMAVNKNVFGS